MAVEVKICGLTNYDDAMVALEAGADYLGFVLFDGSPRYVRPMAFVQLVDRLPQGTRVVPVCVNLPLAEIEAVVRDVPVHRVQLHGDEQPEAYAELSIPLWRAMRLDGEALVPAPATWPGAERFVLDAAPPGQYGGSGETTDWERARDEAGTLALMLAGGLVPGNVAEAVARVRPVGVDTSSGVEKRPGHKDWDAVRKFVQAARRGGRDLDLAEAE